ncbi:PREDICTED: probable RNA-binding protein EIF1AD [Trachymyrmex septentrionalis]|uniref:probable RNA-binding protein EIF1AD n=1 Tax=Trachymyrmex septentrionalis TaxID=34720 RepID=UPI00084F1C53|nr:PREDICTED: probable RNA-binding protein EIF1AD [Trachymyrmex septentrionalis]
MSSVTTKRKYVFQELDDMSLPTDSQSIVRIVQARGHNLHEVVTPAGEQYIVSMPTKFRQNIWIKRGDYIVIEPIVEGKKVKGEIVKILTKIRDDLLALARLNPFDINEHEKYCTNVASIEEGF